MGAPSDKRTTVKLVLSTQPATITCWPKKLPEITLPNAPTSPPTPQSRIGSKGEFASVSKKIPATVSGVWTGILSVPLKAPAPLVPEKKAATAIDPVPAVPDPDVGAVRMKTRGGPLKALAGATPAVPATHTRIVINVTIAKDLNLPKLGIALRF